MILPDHELDRRLSVVSSVFNGDQISDVMTVLCTFFANVYLLTVANQSPETQMSFTSSISNGIINAINARLQQDADEHATNSNTESTH